MVLHSSCKYTLHSLQIRLVIAVLFCCSMATQTPPYSRAKTQGLSFLKSMDVLSILGIFSFLCFPLLPFGRVSFPTLTFWKGFVFGGGPFFHPGMPLKVAPYIEIGIGIASGLRMRRRELLHLLTEVRGICKRSLN